MNRFICMDPKDMVATALNDVKAGEDVAINDSQNKLMCQIKAQTDIPFGNKIALVDIMPGDKIIKYGAVIGECTQQIKKGEIVHVHNVKSLCVDIPPAFKKEIIRQMGIKTGGIF